MEMAPILGDDTDKTRHGHDTIRLEAGCTPDWDAEAERGRLHIPHTG